MNCKVAGRPVFHWSFYITGMLVLSLGSLFQMFSCFVFAKYVVNRLQASKTITKIKWAKESGWIICENFNWIFWDWCMRTWIEEVVNLKDIIHLCINDYWCMTLRMFQYDVSNRCFAMFYVSLNGILRSLSFDMAVAPRYLKFIRSS